MKYVLLSDIHANDIALQTVVDYAKKLLAGEGEYRILFLGDLVGYGTTYGALNCIRWLRSRPDVDWIPGNHDEWIASRGNLSFQGSAVLSLMVQNAFLLHPAHKDDLSWFQQAVLTKIAERSFFSLLCENTTFHFVHACVEEGMERHTYLYPWKKTLVQWNLLKLCEKYTQNHIALFVGHTHYPMVAYLRDSLPVYVPIYYGKPISLRGGLMAINPGSVGQPRDGDPRASFAVLDIEEQTVTFHRVKYDVEKIVMQLEVDGNFNSRFHPLSFDERDAIMNELKRAKKKVDTAELDLFPLEQLETRAREEKKIINAEKTYKELINRIRAGNKDANLSNYHGVYRKVDGGLEVVN